MPLVLLAAAALLLAACAPLMRPNATQTVTVVPEARDEVMVVELPLDLPAGGVTVVPSRRPAFDIPLAHVPPPGTCRIWVPDLPLRDQAPPGECIELEEQVPPEGYLIIG